jgi:hypothetical protein
MNTDFTGPMNTDFRSIHKTVAIGSGSHASRSAGMTN